MHYAYLLKQNWLHTFFCQQQDKVLFATVNYFSSLCLLTVWRDTTKLFCELNQSSWFQLLKYEYLLLLFVKYGSELSIFEFWTVSQTKYANINISLWPLKSYTGHFCLLSDILSKDYLNWESHKKNGNDKQCTYSLISTQLKTHFWPNPKNNMVIL